ncbi:MAG: hypothetical protein Q4G36_08160 [Paracoccus sp. (in: a-proteobacteria)]|nr:hypothetical protein [Paracoccus sp. (in: a-proteobacteria)]
MIDAAQINGLVAAMTGANLPPPGPIQRLIYDGQSLSLINGVSARPDNARAARLDPGGVLMVKGLRNTVGQTVNLQGPQGGRYDQTVAATGIGPAVVEGNWTMAFWTSVALRRRRYLMGLPNPRILTGCNGQGGMGIAEFDADLATGTQGTRLLDNMAYWLRQGQAVLGDLAGPVPYDIFSQGEADAAMAETAYYTAFMRARRDRLRVIAEATGHAAIPCTTQIGSYAAATGPDYGVKLAQVKATMDLGGIVLPCWYPFAIADNNVHPDWIESRKMADLIGYHLTSFEAGRHLPPFIPTARQTGQQVVLDYSTGLAAGDFLTFDRSGKYDAFGGVTNEGFELTGATLQTVQIGADGRSVVLTSDVPATGWSYAMQKQDVTAHAVGGVNYPAHRGLLRKDRAVAGVLTDEPHQEWALSWRGTF